MRSWHTSFLNIYRRGKRQAGLFFFFWWCDVEKETTGTSCGNWNDQRKTQQEKTVWRDVGQTKKGAKNRTSDSYAEREIKMCGSSLSPMLKSIAPDWLKSFSIRSFAYTAPDFSSPCIRPATHSDWGEIIPIFIKNLWKFRFYAFVMLIPIF